MEQKPIARISRQAFVQSLLILLLLMIAAGVLTRVLPAGSYSRVPHGEREIIDPQSYQLVERPSYPVWRWFTAPVEVLWGPSGLTVTTIVIFLLAVGAAFAVLERSDILRATIARVVHRFGSRKYLLLLLISFLFMLIGALFGIFEEVVPLVPVMLALAYSMGWDSLTGLGMSILATNMGFSAAITNPFTIGVAQEIAGLPMFSGAWLRVLAFLTIYGIFAIFLLQHAHKVERNPEASIVYREDQSGHARYSALDLDQRGEARPSLRWPAGWFLVFLALIVLVLVLGPFVPLLAGFLLPLVGLLFLVGGVGAGLLAGIGGRAVLRAMGEGLISMAPGIPLVLMAASINHIISQGGVMDTILHSASLPFSGINPFLSTLLLYGLVLVIEIFIASGSAKAFLLMPILFPLADLVGVNRQIAVTAYTFGDGFSNMVYPTNPVLLISLGLTVVSYPKWIRWSAKLWGWVVLATVLLLALAVAIGFGPY